jgi:uncharacterized membrane protein
MDNGIVKIHRKRHLAKSITYRITASAATFILAFILTGKFYLSLSFMSIDFFIKIAVYYLHERVWYKISKFGVEEMGINKKTLIELANKQIELIKQRK